MWRGSALLVFQLAVVGAEAGFFGDGLIEARDELGQVADVFRDLARRERHGGSAAAVRRIPGADVHVAPVRPEPAQFVQTGARIVAMHAVQPAAAAQHGEPASQRRQPAHGGREAGFGFEAAPVQPAEGIVLAVAVVVAGLALAELVAGEQHRHALREQQAREQVQARAPAGGEDGAIPGVALDAVVVGMVVAVAVAVVLAVGVVVAFAVAGEIGEREAVVAGDEVHAGLRAARAEGFGRAVQARGDVLVRWGGEEFLVLLANSDVQGARLVVERLRAAGFGERPDGTPLTASIGLAERLIDRASDWPELIEVADQRMYAAKLGGRDRAILPGEAIVR